MTKCDQCGEVNPADIHTCTPAAPVPTGAAPCAKVCEANAFQITIRGLKGEIERMKAMKSAPVQEPVGVFREDDDIGHVDLMPHQQMKLKDGDLVYATAPAAQPAQEPAKASKEYTMGDWFNDLENPHGNR